MRVVTQLFYWPAPHAPASKLFCALMFALCLRRCRYDMSSLDPNSVHMSSSRKRMCSLVRLQIFVHAFASAWRVLLDSILHSYQNVLSSTLLLSHAQRCAVFEDALDYSDDSDYMEEVDRLSNTLVLTGPPGVSSLYLKECVVVLVGSPSSIPTDQISLCLFFFHTCTWSSPSPLLVAFSVISFFFSETQEMDHTIDRRRMLSEIEQQ